MNFFGSNIRFLRKQRNMGQEDLANMLGYKSFTTIQKWESGDSEPTLSMYQKVAEIFNVDAGVLATIDLSLNVETEKITLSEEEKELLKYFKITNSIGRSIIIDTSKNIAKAYPKLSRQEMINYLREMPRAAWGGAKNVFNMSDEELEKEYYKIKGDFEDVD